jgi:hypothetical protein
MAYYSLVVWTPTEIVIQARRVLLDPGVNTFNVEVDDIDELTAFLRESGARIVQCNTLDQFEPVPAEPEMLLALASPPSPPRLCHIDVGQVVNASVGLADEAPDRR